MQLVFLIASVGLSFIKDLEAEHVVGKAFAKLLPSHSPTNLVEVVRDLASVGCVWIALKVLSLALYHDHSTHYSGDGPIQNAFAMARVSFNVAERIASGPTERTQARMADSVAFTPARRTRSMASFSRSFVLPERVSLCALTMASLATRAQLRGPGRYE